MDGEQKIKSCIKLGHCPHNSPYMGRYRWADEMHTYTMGRELKPEGHL